MTGKRTAMDVRLVAAISGQIEGLGVSAFCRERGTSRQTFYKWRRRYELGGVDALEELSRAPKTTPGKTSEEIEQKIFELRKALLDSGADCGPGTIQWHLGRELPPLARVPSEATIWRILVAHGDIVPEPKKRPAASFCRFEAVAPNELWQADATKVAVADHADLVEILNFLDDHSRVLVRSKAVETATTENTWSTFCEGVQQWGLPTGHLSDNGLNFSGKLRGYEVTFEINLRAAGVRPITSRPYHPQTCGKVERFHQTLKRWLRKQPLAANLDALQHQLDTFQHFYNHERPHRGIGRITPIERWHATPPIINHPIAIPGEPHTYAGIVNHGGIVTIKPWKIHVGTRYRRQPAIVTIDDTHANVIINGELIRHFELDHTRGYQPSGPRRHPQPLP